MTPSSVYEKAILPALAILQMDAGPRPVTMLLAIGLQESLLRFRRQHNNGPARGLWQFERGGGVRGVLRHAATKQRAFELCAARSVRPEEMAVWTALEIDDTLAAGFARLLLWSDAAPLPPLNATGLAWAYYMRNWRPGKPKPEKWPENWKTAVEFVQGLES